MHMAPNTPGGQEEYRVALTVSFFYRYFLAVAKKLGVADIVGKPEWKSLESATSPLPFHMASSGAQHMPPPVSASSSNRNEFHILFFYLFTNHKSDTLPGGIQCGACLGRETGHGGGCIFR